jgi:hypothetical protein
MEELEELEVIEELEVRENETENNILKVFVYNTKGEKIKEEQYAHFIEIYDYVLEHNSESPDDPYNIYPGTSFPPKGYKWSNDVGDWVEINLFEKWQRGEVEIPTDCKIVNNFMVRKSLSDLYEEGKIELSSDKKIDKELNMIVQKSEQEMIDEGILDWELIYNRLYNDFKIKLDHYLDMYYFKYPKNILSAFKEKADLAKRWANLTYEQRKIEKSFDFMNFQLIISEFKNKDVYLTLEQVEDQLDELCNKIIKKNTEIETKVGSMANLFDQLNEEIKNIKEKKNYLLLANFVHSIDNRILKWIKS